VSAGRKRHLLVDTLGYVLAVVVHSAAIQDKVGAHQVLAQAGARWSRLHWIWADGGYAGRVQEWAWQVHSWFLGLVKRASAVKGWQLLPRRWVVERTFAWLGRFRRLSKDYEYLPETSEALIRVAMIHLLVRRLTRIRNS
jgi:putative transposase